MMSRRPARLIGWSAAAALSAAILSGAALALVSDRRAETRPVFLDLSEIPPAAPSLGAVADPAPVVVDEAPALALPDAPTDAGLPDLLASDTAAPDRPRSTALTLPEADLPTKVDLALPTAPEPDDAKPEPAVRPRPKPDSKRAAKAATGIPKPDAAPDEPAGTDPTRADRASESKAASAGATAPKAEAWPAGGSTQSPAAYARTVMQKIRATKKKGGAGRGIVLVGFSIGPDGSLALVKILKSSGNPALDNVAADHIRRSAPFPPLPSGADRNFSFEFLGK